MKKEDRKANYNALMQCYPLTLDDLDGEIWRDVHGYEGLYQVSNYGRVKSYHTSHGGRILKPLFTKEGYLRIDVFKDMKGKHCLIHRLVAEAFIPNVDSKPQVNHIDGHKFNNYVRNLEWATQKENQQHAVTIGLQASGAGSYQAKFSASDVLYIRNNPGKLNLEQLAKIFNATATTIGRIQKGKNYKTVGGEIREHPLQHPNRITDETRAKVRQLREQGVKVKTLAEMFNTNMRRIFKILKEGD